MKKLFGLAMAVLCLSGCSNDDGPSEPAVNLDHLQQRWFYVSYKLGNQTVDYTGNLPCGKDYIQFLAGNAVKDVDYYDCQEDPDVDEGTYTATTEMLTTTIDGVTNTYTLKKLTNKDLEMEATLNGATVTYIYTSTP
ncbi:hypothetical protein HYN59_06310 [Flavobacterium album]|uniref:Lipocalin-like domain-containing protein n=1 Tax=Flavobacterium album TaxID=2175091 RepID=A0A2S1QWH0_9FLAO|nr:hypothetical protein [Flavobacterium album]AWH84758.1 hypothetical protein HYN59_06310 [Flavobacterium album]